MKSRDHFLSVLFLTAALACAGWSQAHSLETTHGATGMIAATTLLGLSWYGLALPAVAGIELGSRPYWGAYLICASASFYLPYYLWKDARVLDSQAWLYGWGGFNGIGAGLALMFTLLGAFEPDDEELSMRIALGFGLAGSVGLAWTGYALAGPLAIRPADANFIGNAGWYGLLVGAGLAYSLGLAECDWKNFLGLSALAGSALATVASYQLTRLDYYSAGDVGMMGVTGVLGAYWMFLPLVFGGGSVRAEDSAFAAVFGSLLGITVGYTLTGGRDFQSSDAGMALLSTGAGWVGAALGSAILFPLYISAGKFALPMFLAISGSGALVGFALSWYASQSAALTNHEDISAPSSPPAIPTDLTLIGVAAAAVGGLLLQPVVHEALSMDLSVHPEALAIGLSERDENGPVFHAPAFLTLSARF